MSMITSLIAIGSNKGNKVQNINKAAELIKNHIGQIVKFSRIYESHCVDINNNILHKENKFLNCAVKIQFSNLITPQSLLHKLKDIEKKLGRIDKLCHHQEREIDLDILTYADRRVESNELTIPHSQIKKRNFVLKPLHDIDRNMIIENDAIKDLNITRHAIGKVLCGKNQTAGGFKWKYKDAKYNEFKLNIPEINFENNFDNETYKQFQRDNA